MDHLNISFQEMEQEISSLSMKTQGTYRAKEAGQGRKTCLHTSRAQAINRNREARGARV